MLSPFLQDSLALQQFVNTGAWLVETFNQNPRSQPSAALSDSEVMEQFQLARENPEETLFCGNFALFSLLFHSVNDLPTRYIEVVGGNDNHVWTETWLAEHGQWVVADYLHNILLFRDSLGRHLNAADVLHHYETNQEHRLEVLTLEGQGQYIWKALDPHIYRLQFSGQPRLLFFHHLRPSLTYRAPEKIKRYLYPTAWYDVYMLKPTSNTGFYVRLLTIYGWLLLTILLITRWTYDRIKKYQKKFR